MIYTFLAPKRSFSLIKTTFATTSQNSLLYESTRLILLFFSSIAYAEEDIRWKDADEKMQEQQYEEAAKLYKELSHKSDTV